jgi:hypothetical protein
MAFYENKVEHYGGSLVLFQRNLAVAVPNSKTHRKPTWYMRTNKQDPVQQRRQKLVAGIEEQLKVAKAAVKGENYEVPKKIWAKNEQGE